MSCHVLSGTPESEELLSTLKEMLDLGADICEIVTMSHCLEDSLRLLRFMEKIHGFGVPVVSHAMGNAGRITRVLFPVFWIPLRLHIP